VLDPWPEKAELMPDIRTKPTSDATATLTINATDFFFIIRNNLNRLSEIYS
jgi:hypothetical protein